MSLWAFPKLSAKIHLTQNTTEDTDTKEFTTGHHCLKVTEVEKEKEKKKEARQFWWKFTKTQRDGRNSATPHPPLIPIISKVKNKEERLCWSQISILLITQLPASLKALRSRVWSNRKSASLLPGEVQDTGRCTLYSQHKADTNKWL